MLGIGISHRAARAKRPSDVGLPAGEQKRRGERVGRLDEDLVAVYTTGNALERERGRRPADPFDTSKRRAALSRFSMGQRLKIILHDLAMQPVALDLEQPGRARLVAAGGMQGSGDQQSLGLLERHDVRIGGGLAHPRVGAHRIRQIGGGNGSIRAEDAGVLDGVLQFSDVARPIVRPQYRQGVGRELFGRLFVKFCELLEKMLCQAEDIISPIAQRRNRETDDVDTKVKVFAETAVGDHFSQVAVRRGDHSNVGRDRLGAAKRDNGPLLDRAKEFRLHSERKLADFVEEERPALTTSQQWHSGDKACERAWGISRVAIKGDAAAL